MTRYFFQVSGTTSYVDREGRELPDENAVWALAITSTGELLRDIDGGMPDHAEIRMTVVDEDARVVITLTFTADRHGSAVGDRLNR